MCVTRAVLSLIAVLALSGAASCARPPAVAQRGSIDCRHFPNREPAVCEPVDGGGIIVARQSLQGISFGPGGLGAIVIGDQGLYYVTREGKTAPALTFDNGPDY